MTMSRWIHRLIGVFLVIPLAGAPELLAALNGQQPDAGVQQAGGQQVAQLPDTPSVSLAQARPQTPCRQRIRRRSRLIRSRTQAHRVLLRKKILDRKLTRCQHKIRNSRQTPLRRRTRHRMKTRRKLLTSSNRPAQPLLNWGAQPAARPRSPQARLWRPPNSGRAGLCFSRWVCWPRPGSQWEPS